MSENAPREFITPAEVCELVGISRTWLNHLVRKGSFPQPARIGAPPNGHLRFNRQAVIDWLEERARTPDSAAQEFGA